MTTMASRRLSLSLCLGWLVSQPVLGQDVVRRDPHLREEDISATQISVTVRRLEGGLYEYIYDLNSPTTNKGKIATFNVDISCDLDFPPHVYPDPPDQYPGRISPLATGYVPVRAYRAVAADGKTLAGTANISESNAVYWGIYGEPGYSAPGMRVVTPAPPGPRRYEIHVDMETDDIEPDGTGWDYRGAEDDPTIPWLDDFLVVGMTTGPACALPPPPGEQQQPPPPRFAGTPNRESVAINDLLTYSAPLRDRFHVAAGVGSVEVKIHYSSDIDPKTFKVEPGWAKNLFHPVAGGSETVHLPLKDKKSLFQLEVRSTKDKTPRKGDELDQSYKDRDVFEIRRDPAPQPGNARGK